MGLRAGEAPSCAPEKICKERDMASPVALSLSAGSTPRGGGSFDGIGGDQRVELRGRHLRER